MCKALRLQTLDADVSSFCVQGGSLHVDIFGCSEVGPVFPRPQPDLMWYLRPAVSKVGPGGPEFCMP